MLKIGREGAYLLPPSLLVSFPFLEHLYVNLLFSSQNASQTLLPQMHFSIQKVVRNWPVFSHAYSDARTLPTSNHMSLVHPFERVHFSCLNLDSGQIYPDLHAKKYSGILRMEAFMG